MKFNILLFLVVVSVCFSGIEAREKNEFSDPRIISIKTKQPEEKKIYPIAIIGAGAAGTMAVKRAVLNNDEVLLFTGNNQERRRSRGNWVRKVDNVPGLEKYERTILELRNEVLEELVKSPLIHNLYVIEDSVYSIEKEVDVFKLIDGAGHIYYARYVVMATGIMDEQPSIDGSIRPILAYANGQTVAYCLVCDGHRSLGKKTVVIGCSESAGDVALILSTKYQLEELIILTNGQKHEFSSALLKSLQSKSIRIIEAPILKVLGNEKQKEILGFELANGDIVEAEMCFVALGIRPNNQLAIQLGAKLDASGLVITDENGESSVPNLFVIGDLRSNSMKQIYTAWQHAVESMQLINCRIQGF